MLDKVVTNFKLKSFLSKKIKIEVFHKNKHKKLQVEVMHPAY